MASISSLLQEDRKLGVSGCILYSVFWVNRTVFLWSSTGVGLILMAWLSCGMKMERLGGVPSIKGAQAM